VAESDKILLRRYHEQGDLQAREQLIEQYMSLVRSLARRYSYRGEQLDDLVQIGAIGLIKAIDRFDLSRGVELTTYATPNIIGEIKRHFRDRGWSVRVPRGLQELNVQLSKLIEQLTVQLGRSPTIPELAKAAGVEEEEVLEALESGRAYSSLSLSQGTGQEDGEELDPLESLGTEEHQYEVSEDRAVLAPGFRALDDRERRILHLRFFEGLTQSQIAQQVGISQMHVSRLIRRALEKIRAEIVEEEPAEPVGQRRAERPEVTALPTPWWWGSGPFHPPPAVEPTPRTRAASVTRPCRFCDDSSTDAPRSTATLRRRGHVPAVHRFHDCSHPDRADTPRRSRARSPRSAAPAARCRGSPPRRRHGGTRPRPRRDGATNDRCRLVVTGRSGRTARWANMTHSSVSGDDRNAERRGHRSVEAHALRPVRAPDLDVVEHVSEEVERHRPSVH
jgi:RNA polymerase sigma-B factor